MAEILSEIPEAAPHPWARYIKDNFSHRIKHAHNSIRNPKYPPKHQKHGKKQPASDRVQFTIIGDQVTKEFIYCKNLVTGLHKYRSKNFDVPIIRGVTTVDWPEVWNELKVRYGNSAYCLQSSVAVLSDGKVLGGEKELKQMVETKYIYHLCIDYYNEGVAEFARFIKSTGRPFAYMHVSIDDEHIGTLIFMLYTDIAPYTCENFLRLCKETKGGYGGTPVHRIVKDGWIQCGGFGLKSTPLNCENFIIPFDRRGVLAMANDGRDIDCSTQFFVLLQPATWMTHKYVAFGQLIEGENTLKLIESVTTKYESPTSKIILYRCGVFNMECQDIIINKGANDYISGHIEDLNELSDLMWKHILQKVFLEAQLRELERLGEHVGSSSESSSDDGGIHATQRFKKEDIQKQLERNQRGSGSISESGENHDFDIEEYEYEPEESSYQHQSIRTDSVVVKPQKPFYIPLTDVPYPGEVDSDFDLKRFLKGDYCLESDLDKHVSTNTLRERNGSYESYYSQSDSSSDSLDLSEEMELKKYLKMNVDRVSFAGGIVSKIAKGEANMTTDEKQSTNERRKSEQITDQKLRKLRLASIDETYSYRQPKVSIDAPDQESMRIKRRPTGFIRVSDLDKLDFSRVANTIEDDDEDDDSIQSRDSFVYVSGVDEDPTQPAFRRGKSREKEMTWQQSTLVRLYDEIDVCNERGPTLKDYVPVTEKPQKNSLLTYSPLMQIRSDESTRERYMRHSSLKEHSLEHVLNLQHGKKITRKISSDYVKTINRIEKIHERSIRTVEYAKTRPTISVSQYQLKNQKYKEGRMSISVKTVMEPAEHSDTQPSSGGLRLAEDTTSDSMSEACNNSKKPDKCEMGSSMKGSVDPMAAV